jgi:hypothetical protein
MLHSPRDILYYDLNLMFIICLGLTLKKLTHQMLTAYSHTYKKVKSFLLGPHNNVTNYQRFNQAPIDTFLIIRFFQIIAEWWFLGREHTIYPTIRKVTRHLSNINLSKFTSTVIHRSFRVSFKYRFTRFAMLDNRIRLC